MSKTFYITTPIYYPNAKPHMGHAYTSVLCDIAARYHRFVGEEVYLLTGTDENTAKVGESAEALGKSVREFTDESAQEYKSFFGQLQISFNHFIRTTDEDEHWPGVVEMWERLTAKGDIYKGVYEGLYCTGCEGYKTEKELVDGKCPDHNREPEKISEENYFFALSKYKSEIKKRIESGELSIDPESRRNEVLSFLEGDVEDVSFSRPKEVVPWGVPVPGDESQVVYVWCDALTNYVSALGFGSEDTELFDRFWPAQYHVIGKDILRFHAVIWPGMLLSAGLPLPRGVFVHGMILSEGKKMSKTLGNVIDPYELLEMYGSDGVRYILGRHVSPVEDSDITKDQCTELYNAHLANGLGNVTSRVLKMVEQYEVDLSFESLPEVSEVLKGEDVEEYHRALKDMRVDKALDVVWGLISFIDSYITETKPFQTIKDDEDQAHQDIRFLVERLWEVSVLLVPFMSDTSEKIQKAIGAGKLEAPLFKRIEVA